MVEIAGTGQVESISVGCRMVALALGERKDIPDRGLALCIDYRPLGM